MIAKDITKEADVLLRALQKGSINIHEMEQFLAKVVSDSPSLARNARKDRFAQQLENLDRGRARKPS